MYDLETVGESAGEMRSTMGFRIVRKYQYEEIFWENNYNTEQVFGPR
jgi:hypothetical protein